MADSKYMVHIVDDDPSVRVAIKRLMESDGYDARVFASAREFLAAGLPGADSCLILDVAMPEMDGLELQEKLAAAGRDAPVIFITALDDPEIRERAKRAGAAGFFQKPVDADALLDTVKRALRRGEGRGARGGERGRPEARTSRAPWRTACPGRPCASFRLKR